ncbi:hypothetical protein F4803DRAFT_557535 [Xylaria telfairii]|nr:hypothetical protein F4803DRAFT_557535 [Xylaria telfairii]
MASIEREEKVPLFVDEGDTYNPEARTVKRRLFQRSKYATAHGVIFLFQLLLLTANVTFFVSNAVFLRSYAREYSDNHTLQRTFSPAEAALEYIAVEELTYEQGSSPYTGEPRAELDQAWSKLLS